jgi:hypothetical protein
MHQPHADTARCLGFTLPDICTGNWSWSWCYWDKVQPRSYTQITENAIEFNYPVMSCLPIEMCVKDNIQKVYFDKFGGEPYHAAACTPYHTCCVLELCGQTLAIAPHPACANCCCMNMFPCLFKLFPGLKDADALVAAIKTAKAAFPNRAAAPAFMLQNIAPQ